MKSKVLFSFLLSGLLIATGNAQTYVATSGSDITGNGSSSLPYKTILKGVTQVATGSTVFVAPGTYNEISEIFVGRSMSIVKNGSAEVIVDATSRGTGPNKYMLAVVNTSNVTIDGITFANNIGNASKGIWVLGSGNNITVKNCSVENIGWISNNLSALPANSSIATNAIKVEGNAATALTNVTLLDNNVENCATGWGEAVTITGNVNGFTVDGNHVFDIANIGIVAAGNYSNTGAPSNVNQARNGLIIGNEVYDCMSGIANSAGIYLDGSLNVRVEKNEIYSCGVGLSIGGEQAVGTGASIPGGHTVNNNLIYNNSIAGAFIGTNVSGNAIQNTKVFNNTFYKSRTGAVINGVTTVNGVAIATVANDFGGEIQLQNINGVTFKNNLVYALNNKKAFVALSGYTVSNYVSDYNLFYRDTNTDFFLDLTGVSFNGITTTGSYSTVAAFSAVSLQDANSVSGLPGFVNPAGNDYALTTSAFARNKGTTTYVSSDMGNTDYIYQTRLRGGRIDIGCYEVQTSASRLASEEVVENTQKTILGVYPNPATDFIIVNMGDKVNNGTIEVISETGVRLLVVQKINAGIQKIDLRSIKVKNQYIVVKTFNGYTRSVKKILVR